MDVYSIALCSTRARGWSLHSPGCGRLCSTKQKGAQALEAPGWCDSVPSSKQKGIGIGLLRPASASEVASLTAQLD